LQIFVFNTSSPHIPLPALPQFYKMPFTDEDKIIIKYLRLKYGHGRKRILDDHPEKPEWTAGGIDHLLRKINTTHDVARKEGSGRPREMRTQENIELVEELICSQEEPGTHTTPADISKQTGIPESSVRRIVKLDLGLVPLKKIKSHGLSPADVDKRLTRCKRLVRFFTNDIIARTFFSDEKIFKLQQWYNPQNDRIYVEEGTKKSEIEDGRLLVERKKFPRHVMISAAVSKLGKTQIHFIDQGIRIDGEYYRNKLLKNMIPEMNALANGKFVAAKGEYVFMQDGARAHTAGESLQYLRENVPQLLEPEMWPPNSPDLNPCDYSIWGLLEKNVYHGRKITSLPELKSTILQEWDKLPQEVIDRCIDSFKPRLNRVIEAEGGHIEKFD
jgi:transposase